MVPSEHFDSRLTPAYNNPAWPAEPRFSNLDLQRLEVIKRLETIKVIFYTVLFILLLYYVIVLYMYCFTGNKNNIVIKQRKIPNNPLMIS